MCRKVGCPKRAALTRLVDDEDELKRQLKRRQRQAAGNEQAARGEGGAGAAAVEPSAPSSGAFVQLLRPAA